MINLIPVTENHTDFILSIVNDPRYSVGFPRRGPIQFADHLRFLKALKNDQYYVIQADKDYAGVVSLYDIDSINSRAEWGRFIVIEEYRSLGFPVGRMMIRKAFKELGLHKLYCQVLSSNKQSLDFNLALGFKEEGVLKDHYYLDDEYVHIHYLAKYNR